MQRPGVFVAIAVGLTALVAPIWLSVHLAWRQSLAAEQNRLGDKGHLQPPYREAGPIGAGRQMAAHRQHRLCRRLRAPENAEAELEHVRRVDEPLGDELLGEPDMAELETLHLGLDARRPRPLRVASAA